MTKSTALIDFSVAYPVFLVPTVAVKCQDPQKGYMLFPWRCPFELYQIGESREEDSSHFGVDLK